MSHNYIKKTNNPKLGRPPAYNAHIADLICEQLAEGKSIRTIVNSDSSMPRMSTIFEWLRTYPDFAEQYSRARDSQADAMADDIQGIAEEVLKGKLDPNAARVAVDAKKWIASKLKPKVYGDKIDIKAEVTQVKPLLGGVTKGAIEGQIVEQLALKEPEKDDDTLPDNNG